MSPFMISHCSDFGIRRPYEYEILNSHDFRHEFGGKPMLSRSMYEAYRRSHDGHMNTTRLYPKYPRILTNDIRSGSFAYDVDALFKHTLFQDYLQYRHTYIH